MGGISQAVRVCWYISFHYDFVILFGTDIAMLTNLTSKAERWLTHTYAWPERMNKRRQERWGWELSYDKCRERLAGKVQEHHMVSVLVVNIFDHIWTMCQHVMRQHEVCINDAQTMACTNCTARAVNVGPDQWKFIRGEFWTFWADFTGNSGRVSIVRSPLRVSFEVFRTLESFRIF